MKKKYKDLEVEVVNFAAEDVITASGDDCMDLSLPCECVGGLDEVCECHSALDA